MDVGVWETKEERKKPKPTMTFGLLEHNAIALCNYYADGNKHTSIPKNNPKYNFKNSLINQFLEKMLLHKYGAGNTAIYKVDTKKYHILNIKTFPSNSLLDEKDSLIILIPDLHLHFFKDTYLDNFVTYHENVWGSGKPKSKPLGKRTSMEKYFGAFLKSIKDFQDIRNFKTHVLFLGDTFELWETHILFFLYGILKRNRKKMYIALNKLITIIQKDYAGAMNEEQREVINKLSLANISEKPIDEKFVKQISALTRNNELIKKLYINPTDSETLIKEKAENIKIEILKKYHDQNGVDYEKLLSEIKNETIYFYPGNHDNFFSLKNLDPFNRFPIEYSVDPSIIKPHGILAKHIAVSQQSKIFFAHGHNFDKYNNDYACGVGYLITMITTFFEGIMRGNLLKKYEKVFRANPDIRMNYLKEACRVFKYWEYKVDKDNDTKLKSKKSILRSKIIIHAHTHEPVFKDITRDYNKWKSELKITSEEPEILEFEDGVWGVMEKLFSDKPEEALMNLFK